jgi:hypothetical protein
MMQVDLLESGRTGPIVCVGFPSADFGSCVLTGTWLNRPRRGLSGKTFTVST